MKAIIRWINDALAVKDIGPAMTHYRIMANTICATNGFITASHPWPYDQEFLVSGVEFEKILARMEGQKDDPVMTVIGNDKINIRSGRFHGTIYTLPIDSWNYPGVDGADWLLLPDTLVQVLKTLRAFISDNPAQAWAGCVALENNNCYATNNIAVAGCECPVGNIEALLPSFAIDFIMKRLDGLQSWAWTDSYVAFRWDDGAWMRSQLVIGKFPERAAALVREAYDSHPTQVITDEFRAAFADVAELAEDTIRIYANRIESKFKKSVIEAEVSCEVPDNGNNGGVDVCSIWGARFLLPVIAQATCWSPGLWGTKDNNGRLVPTPFKGPNCAGVVQGRRE
jgi:hypothetical protein